VSRFDHKTALYHMCKYLAKILNYKNTLGVMPNKTSNVGGQGCKHTFNRHKVTRKPEMNKAK